MHLYIISSSRYPNLDKTPIHCCTSINYASLEIGLIDLCAILLSLSYTTSESQLIIILVFHFVYVLIQIYSYYL